MAGSGQRFLRHMGAIVRGGRVTSLGYSTGRGVGNADQNSRMSEWTFLAKIHSSRIWGPDTLMPNSGVSQSSCPALQVLDPICLSQSVFIFMAKSSFICETIELGVGQSSSSPSPQRSPGLLPISQLPLTTKLGAAAPGLATLKMTLAQQWELGDRDGT